jgi:glycosyltransferase involved in cell wall biosynthesis
MVRCGGSGSDRPSALLIVPIAPAPTGNGLAMRAAVTVRGLARACNLTTAVVPVSDPEIDERDLGWAAERSERCLLVPLPEPADAARQWIASPDGRAAVAAAQPLPGRARLACPGVGLREIGGRAFDLVWTMRLYLAGVALPYRGRTGRMVIDLDEDDAATKRAIADLHHRRGELAAASRLAAEADAYERLVAHAAPWFDQIVTATDRDSRACRHRHRSSAVTTVPNAVTVRVASPRRSHGHGPPSILFVGNLNYLPNLDAAERLAVRILPVFRHHFEAAELHLAGAGEAAARLAHHPGVKVHGFVADLGPLYARAAMTIVPLRAGGGSQLKILESFAYNLPVVATPTAASGLDVSDGDQLLVADDDSDLVAAALRIATDSDFAGRLAARAARFVAGKHDAEAVAARIADLAREPDAFERTVC